MHHDHHCRTPRLANGMSEGFKCFQKLPAEIRTMIWEYSLADSRVYEVLDAPNATQKTPAQLGLMFANVHPEPPPALAAVCRESRYFVLRHYKPLTLGKTTKYVDLSRDLLLLEPYLLVKRLHRTLNFMSLIPLVRDHINRLALGTSYGVYTGICHPVLNWKVSKTSVGKLLSSLARFPKLKTLIFIVHQEFQFEFDFRWPHAGGSSSSSSSGTPTHGLPLSHHISAHHPAAAHSQPPPPFTSSIRNPAATAGHLPPPPNSSVPPPPLHIQPHQRPPLPQTPIPHHPPLHHPSQPHRPQQVVHQAYRFKFDIEANINHSPPRPHVNELLYYPLDYGDDRSDDCYDLNDADSEGEDAEEGEWCDPWPTNDDWRRFRRRFGRAVRGAVQVLEAAAQGEGEAGARGGSGGGFKGVEVGLLAGDGRGGNRERDTEARRERIRLRAKGKLCVPALKGASLLWRYTRGGYV